MLRQAEDGGAGGGLTLQGASQSASDRITAALEGDGGETPETPPEQPETPEQEPAAPEGEPAPEQPTPAEQAAFLEFDHGGRGHKLSKDEVVNLVRYAIRLHEDAYQASQRAPSPAPEAPKPAPSLPAGLAPEVQKGIMDFLEAKLGPLNQALQGHEERWAAQERQALQAEYMRETEAAMEKQAIFKSFPAEFRDTFKGMILHTKYLNPDMTWDSAARKIGDALGSRDRDQNGRFVQKKLEQAARRTDGPGGASPAPGGEKKLTKLDVHNGKLRERVARTISSRLAALRD